MTNDKDDEQHHPDPLGELPGVDPLALLKGALRRPGTTGQEQADRQRLGKIKAEIESRLVDLQVLELLGEGGMGSVWKVRQRKLDRVVALKVLSFEGEEVDKLARRFEREAQALARLAHPNIVAIHNYGRDGSFCWLLMECVQGSTLRDLLKAGDLAPLEALALVRPLCDALQFAHDKGIVHRDIKPENVLIDATGNPKIADFGLAKILGEPAALVSLTATRQVLGTLRYMAPEQLDRPQEVDHRADIYALGVVFYEMLTGEIPQGRFALPSEKADSDPRLDNVVLRTLERDPGRRYQSAQAVKRAVDAAGTAPVQSKGTAPFLRLPRSPFPGMPFGAWLAPALIPLALLTPLPPYFRFACAFALMLVGLVALREIRDDWPAQRGLLGALAGVLYLPATLVFWTPQFLLTEIPRGYTPTVRSVFYVLFALVVFLSRRALVRRLNARLLASQATEPKCPTPAAPRLATGAWVGPVLGLLGFLVVCFVLTAHFFFGYAPDPDSQVAELQPRPFPWLPEGLWLLSLVLACLVGLVTRARLHQLWPQQWGFGGALFAAMLLPFLILYGLVYWLIRLAWSVTGASYFWVDSTLQAGLPISLCLLLILLRKRELDGLEGLRPPLLD